MQTESSAKSTRSRPSCSSGPARPPAGAALRRPAPARRARPRHGAPSGRVPDGRAALQSRRQAARAHAHRARGAAQPPRRDLHLRHARPGRGDDDVRPRGDDGRRARSCSSARPRELYARPANRQVAQFIGSPAINLLPARGGRRRRVELWPADAADRASPRRRVQPVTRRHATGGAVPRVRAAPTCGPVPLRSPRALRRIENLGAEFILHFDRRRRRRRRASSRRVPAGEAAAAIGRGRRSSSTPPRLPRLRRSRRARRHTRRCDGRCARADTPIRRALPAAHERRDRSQLDASRRRASRRRRLASRSWRAWASRCRRSLLLLLTNLAARSPC